MEIDIDTIVYFKTMPSDFDPVKGDFSKSAEWPIDGINGRYTLNSEMSFNLDMPEIASLFNATAYPVQLGTFHNIYDIYHTELKRLGRIIFIVEAWMLYGNFLSLIDLKLCDDDAEIIVLAWDDFYYTHNLFSTSNEYTVKNIELATLYLTNDPSSIHFLRERMGVDAQFFISTPCKKLLEKINQPPLSSNSTRPSEIGCFMTFKNTNEYRTRLRRYLYKTFQYPFLGMQDTQHLSEYNIEQTLQDYLQIDVHVGNTSSTWACKRTSDCKTYHHQCNNPNCFKPNCVSTEISIPVYYKEHLTNTYFARCMKGVKDFLAPFLNAILIYDDYYWNTIFYKDVFPLYKYDDFETIKETFDEVTKDLTKKIEIINKQKEWIKKHAFFNQFKYILENNKSIFDEAIFTNTTSEDLKRFPVLLPPTTKEKGWQPKPILLEKKSSESKAYPMNEKEYSGAQAFVNIPFASFVRQESKPGICIAEIGAWLGRTAALYIESIHEQQGTMYAVDLFNGWYPHTNGNEDPNHLEKFLSNISPYRSCVEVLKGLSESQIPKIPDNSLDICFIDSDHRYDMVKKDIELCIPKMKSGGVLCGHDCESFEHVNTFTEVELNSDFAVKKDCHAGVVQAVFDFFGRVKLSNTNWFVQI